MMSKEKEEKYTKFDENDQVKYEISYIRNSKGKITEMIISYKSYPLLHRGYGNYEELNVGLRRHGKNANIEIYFIRQNWNGTGYFPVCEEKLKIDDNFFDVNVSNDNVKEVVLEILRKLKDYLENSDCEHALRYFPE
jgi:hypothetical protein